MDTKRVQTPFIPLGDNLWKRGATFYGRVKINGHYTWRRLKAIAVKNARAELATLVSNHSLSKIGLAIDPWRKTEFKIAELWDQWQAVGFPNRNLITLSDSQAHQVKAKANFIKPILGNLRPADITIQTCDKYHQSRTGETKRSHRAVELELAALSRMFGWAVRAGHIQANPLAAGIPRYRNPSDITNCSATMPMSDEEFHMVANFLLENPRSAALGWQFLIEGLTGVRTSEILMCRWDAPKPPPRGTSPGYMDDHSLYIERLKDGIFPYILLECTPGFAPLRTAIEALRKWHQQRYKDTPTPWWFPGRTPSEPLDPTSLVHAIGHACETLEIHHITSHGLRAYHVRTLRSLGIDDSEISKRLGHRSGVRLVETTYGLSEPGWFGARKQDFIPTGMPPAWDAVLTPNTNTKE
jgi:integrase